MSHELAGAFKQAIGIGKLGATKKPDIDMGFEGIGVSECRVPDTRGRMAGSRLTALGNRKRLIAMSFDDLAEIDSCAPGIATMKAATLGR
jgi:hypothetical protein